MLNARLAVLTLVLCGLTSTGCNTTPSAPSNPLLGTWTSNDPGCATKWIFTGDTSTDYEPAVGANPAYHNTGAASYTVKSPQLVFVNGSGDVDTWELTDSTHAVPDNANRCHYTKQ